MIQCCKRNQGWSGAGRKQLWRFGVLRDVKSSWWGVSEGTTRGSHIACTIELHFYASF
jgi:hypothetical protein